MKAFVEGAPVKLHMPGKPWHKAKGRLVRKNEAGTWTVSIKHWPAKAYRANPQIGEHRYVGVVESGMQLLPTLDRDVPGAV
jgi:hypothetical protein